MTAEARRQQKRRQSDPSPDTVALERSLPCSLEAERSVLGTILLHSNTFDRIAPILRVDDFFRDAHKRIFGAISHLVLERKVEADFLAIVEELEKRGDLVEIGGRAYISALVDGMPRSTNVEHYAAVVKEKSTLRGIINTANTMLVDAYVAEQNAGDIITAADRAMIDLQLGSRGSRMQDLRTSSFHLQEDLDYRINHKGELTGTTSGFKDIDNETMGWQPGDLIVIGARPSIGKTTFVLNNAVEVARAGGRVAIFSLEMRRKQLEYRMLSYLSGVELTKLLGGYVDDANMLAVTNSIEQMHALAIHIDDRAGQSIWDIRTACRKLQAEEPLKLVIIDYVQLMPGTLDRRGTSRNDEVTDISRRTKGLADDCSVPVILLSQLSRASDKRNDPRPRLTDLRESGALEQDADIVGFLHRKNHREGGYTEFILEKQRNGPTGTCALTLLRETSTFINGGAPPAPPVKEEKPKPVARVGAAPKGKH